MDNNSQASLDLRTLTILIIDNTRFIGVCVFALTSLSIIYSLMATPIYEATAELTHSSAMSRSQTSSTSLEAVASIVQGGSLDGAGVSSEEKIAIKRITSKDYFQRIYNNPLLLSCLYEECDLSKLDTENKESNSINDTFVKPPFMRAYAKFRADFAVFPNVEITYFSFRHHSPTTAYSFLNWIIRDSNNYVRDHDVSKANKTIEFLNTTMLRTKNMEVQKLVSALISKEIQTLALSEKTEFFAFEILDSPYIPENRIFPKRSLIVLTTFFVSLFLSISALVLNKVFDIRGFIQSLEIQKRLFRR
jgi:hypothetical protein